MQNERIKIRIGSIFAADAQGSLAVMLAAIVAVSVVIAVFY